MLLTDLDLFKCVPNSAFLQDLNRDVAMLNQLNFTSIWTPFDLMIVPANSSQMPVGKNVQVPVLTHATMITEPRSLVAVVAALSEPLKQNRQFGHSQNYQK
jgi:triacylglycerol lipase